MIQWVIKILSPPTGVTKKLSRVRTVFVFFAPHVFCDLVSPSCWLLIWFQVCLVISLLIVCVFKVQSIQFVLSVFECLPYLCSLDVLPCLLLKTLVSWIPRLLVPGFLARVWNVTERPTETVTSVYTLRFVSVFIQCLVSVVSLWIPSSGPNFFSSCWSRGTNLSRTIPDYSWC